MVTPSTSLGSMSLVNCRRWKVQATDRASAWASVVFPTPGTSSMSRCPRANRHTREDRKSTRLNSSHGYISYAVFCLKKKKERVVGGAAVEVRSSQVVDAG